MKKLVVFDLNDTLIDSRKTYNKILIKLLSKNYCIDEKRANAIYLKSQLEALRNEKKMTEKKFYSYFHKILILNMGIAYDEKSRLKLKRIIREMDALFAENVTIYPNVLKALRDLKSLGWNIAILTGSQRNKNKKLDKTTIEKKKERVINAIETTMICPLIDKIFFTYEKNILKPSKAAFDMPIKHFKINNSNVIFIGDRHEDLKSADFGYKTIHFNPMYKRKCNLEVFRDYKNLPKILEEKLKL